MNFKSRETQFGIWVEGCEEESGAIFCAKVFETDSKFGINGGKISKLEIRRGGDILCRYERGWGIPLVDEVKPFYNDILAQFN